MLNLTKTTNILAALSLLAAASAWGWSPMFKINEDDSFLIDDFEDGDYASFLGPWNITTEEKFNTELKYSIVDSKDLESKVLKIEYTFPAKDLQLNDHYEWIDAQIYVANYTSLDFSKCTEMQFDYKATYSDGDVDPSECDYYEDCRLDLRFRALGDEKKADVGRNYHLVRLGTTSDWKTVTVHWEDFDQEKYWGIALPTDSVKKNLVGFSWFIHSEIAASGTLELDNFRCVNRPIYEVTYMANDTVYYSTEVYKGTTHYGPPVGCTPTDEGEFCTEPTKEPTDDLMYTFTGWDKKFAAITGPTVYTAQFKSEQIPWGAPLDITGNAFLIDDFEDGNLLGELGGSWIFFDSDNQNGGAKTSELVKTADNNYLKIGSLDESYEWQGARLFLKKDSSAVDLSQCQAIQYRYKGRSHQLRVESSYESEENWMHWHIDVPESEDWKTKIVYWNDLVGYDYFVYRPLDPINVVKKNVTELTWQYDGFYGETTNGSFSIDEIQCVRNMPEYKVAFYSENKLVQEKSYPAETSYKNVAVPENPVKSPANGISYVFTGWEPVATSDLKVTENLRLDAVYTPVKPLTVSGRAVLFDNLEDDGIVGNSTDAWSTFMDDYGSTMDVEVASEKDNKWLRVQYENVGWTGVKLNLQQDGYAIDLSQCEAIQYDYRGLYNHQFRVESVLDDEKSASHFRISVERPEEINNLDGWVTETVFLNSLICDANYYCDENNVCGFGVCNEFSKAIGSVAYLGWDLWEDAEEGEKALFEIDNIKCIRTKFGAVTIAADNSTAIIDGHFADNDVLDIPEDVVVGGVEFQRTFEVGKSATVMFPFSIEVSKVNGADFYSLAEMIYDKEEWKAGAMKVTGMLEANTPYLAIPTEAAITFKLEENEKITLNTTGSKVTKLGDWEFRGAYGRIAMADSAHLLGRAYGFAGEDRDGFKIGQFVKLGKVATVPATRTYLVKTESAQCPEGAMCAPRASSVANAENLPDRIIVEFRDEEDKVMAVGTLNTKTGKIRLDRYHLDHWYDLRGHRLNGKPTAKGTYYNNGNMVIIK